MEAVDPFLELDRDTADGETVAGRAMTESIARVADAEVCASVESFTLPLRGPEGVGFTDGKRTCETAIAIRDRNKARKKRLSIQGTGSYPPGRKG